MLLLYIFNKLKPSERLARLETVDGKIKMKNRSIGIFTNTTGERNKCSGHGWNHNWGGG